MILPSLFIGHGAPTELIEPGAFQDALKNWGTRNPNPAAIVVMSAHWLSRGKFEIGSTPKPETIYDYMGFPEEMYQIDYPAPGSPQLAQKIEKLLEKLPTQLNPQRGLDHGAWIPLKMIYPDAQIPVLQISIPFDMEPSQIFEVGKALAPLRQENILLVASGNVVHNLRMVKFGDKLTTPDPWATQFENWVKTNVRENKSENLFQFDRLGPQAAIAQAFPDHFYPLFFLMGTRQPSDSANSIYDQIHYGNISMWSFEFKS